MLKYRIKWRACDRGVSSVIPHWAYAPYTAPTSQAFPNFRVLSVKMTFGFLVGSMNFGNLLSVSCEGSFFARI